MIPFTKRQRMVIARTIGDGVKNAFAEKARRKRFAIRLGVSPSTVSRWILGKTTPSIKHLILISEILNIPFHKLCGFSGTRLAQTRNIAFNNMVNTSIIDEHAAFATCGICRNTDKVMEKILTHLEGLPKHHDN